MTGGGVGVYLLAVGLVAAAAAPSSPVVFGEAALIAIVTAVSTVLVAVVTRGRKMEAGVLELRTKLDAAWDRIDQLHDDLEELRAERDSLSRSYDRERREVVRLRRAIRRLLDYLQAHTEVDLDLEGFGFESADVEAALDELDGTDQLEG